MDLAGIDTREPARSRLRRAADRLPNTRKRIASYITENIREVLSLSVTEIAERTEASPGSVVALAKVLGYPGFQQFKIALARDLVVPAVFAHEELKPGDGPGTAVRKVFGSHIKAFQDTRNLIDVVSLERAVHAVRDAVRVEVYGLGAVAPIAKLAADAMAEIGINAQAIVDSQLQVIAAVNAASDVTTITFSDTGRECVTATMLARQRGARTIVITTYGSAPITAFADTLLFAADQTGSGPRANGTPSSLLAVFDAIAAVLEQHLTPAGRRDR